MADRTVTIPGGGTTTPAFCRENLDIVGFRTDAALAGTAFTVQESQTEAGTFLPVYSGSSAVSITVGASRFVAVSRETLRGAGPWLKIVSGSAQGAGTPSVVGIKYQDPRG